MAKTSVAPPANSDGLLRQLGVSTAIALVVSNMVGTGIYTTSGFLAGQLGDVSLVLGIWLVGAICAIAGAFCYSELGVNFPSSGGEYVYLTNAYGPSWGFMTGWISFVAGFSAPIAAQALAFSQYLGYFFPGLRTEASQQLFSFAGLTVKFGGAQMAAIALIAALTALNLFGIQRVAKFQNVFTSLKILVMVAFIVMGFAVGSGSWEHFSQSAVRDVSTPIGAQFAISLFWIYLSYSGWNAATYVAEELKRPERTLPLALTVGTLLVGALYLILNVVFIYALPLEKMKGELAIGALAAKNLFGPNIAGAFGALMALSLVSTVNANMTIGPRVYYAMAKNKAFFASAAEVHPKWHTPWNAILAQGVASLLMTLIPFDDLFPYIARTLTLFAALSVASIFIFRRRPGWRKLAVVNFAFPLWPALFLLVSAWMYFYGITLNPMGSLATLLTVAIGALLYHFLIRQKA
ncbi:MAG: amino acid permease [Acidobacteria bacterium]|nr:amino acid permease [Acidobacteriota bacterium]